MAAPPEGTRVALASEKGWAESWERYNNEFTWNVLDALFEAAQAAGRTPAQIAINWVLHRPGVTAPIIGARNEAQLEDNLDAVGWKLAPELAELLEQASRLPVITYPYDEAAEQQQRRGRDYED